MKRMAFLCLMAIALANAWPIARAAPALPAEQTLVSGWQVTQDVRDLGEQQEWFKPQYPAHWQPIDRLTHIPLLFAKQPFFGREIRYFNELSERKAIAHSTEFPKSFARRARRVPDAGRINTAVRY